MEKEAFQMFVLEKWFMWSLKPSSSRTNKVKALILYDLYKEYLKEYERGGANAYMERPLTIRKFYNLLRDLIASGQVCGKQKYNQMYFKKGQGGWYIEGATLNPEVEDFSQFYKFLLVDQLAMSHLRIPVPKDFTAWLEKLQRVYPGTSDKDVEHISAHWEDCLARMYWPRRLQKAEYSSSVQSDTPQDEEGLSFLI